MKIKIYGCRASVPFSRPAGSFYGGNTSCLAVESKGVFFVFDAGSGLVAFEKELANTKKQPEINIIISHLHLDHIIGLGTFAPLWDKNCDVRFFTCNRDKTPLKQQILGLFKPPYWPDSLADATGALCFPVECGTPFAIKHFTFTPFEANHPDKTFSVHMTDGEKSLVYLLDNEVEGMDTAAYSYLADLCSGADLVVFDAAYSKEDYPQLKGWGHSTVEQGVKLASICRPKRMLFSHLGQQYDDAQLNTWSRFFETESGCEFILAREGTVLEI
ncbi:MAG: MBL fold metallo-hydrolase [Defluviitaleaceae bacterium]|nr:MBL fold metallo-hydrolase [Defluviitaleaceae bacterium]